MADFFLAPRMVPRTGDDSPASSLLRFVARMSGWHQLSLSLLAGLIAVLSTVPLELQRRIVNEAIGDRNLSLLMWLGGIYAFVLLAQTVSKFCLRLYQGWVSESAIRYCRGHLAGIERRRAAGRVEDARGKAVSVIGPEIDKLGGFVGEGLSQPIVNVGMLLAIGGYMIAVEPVIALFSLLFFVPQFVLVPWIQGHINRLVEARVTMMRELSDSVVAISGNGGADLDGRLGAVYGNRMRIFVLKFLLKAAVTLLNALAPLAVLVIGGILVIRGETTVGVIVAFIGGFDRLADPIRELIAYYRVASQARVQHDMVARWI